VFKRFSRMDLSLPCESLYLNRKRLESAPLKKQL
jgi:hypothetical protein